MIVVFAKAPRPGFVKTRLAAVRGAEWAAGLHDAFVRDTLELSCSLGQPVELHTDVETAAWDDFPVTKRLQVPGDLGCRMLAALQPGHRMILGSDAPTLPASHLRQLLQVEADIALGPAEDGGYYAIRARRTHPGMFDGVEWSTVSVLNQNVAAAHKCGLSVELGPSWFDVDTMADLHRLLQAPLPRHTAGFLRRTRYTGI